ncbi:hypothetical protein [Bdellovibrio sp. HCB337]|uniref:hypothetical protein n=1 Tax=Bdellovibrio sp. HCB337 TaxID=3394358 RepID=UPI0039A55D62
MKKLIFSSVLLAAAIGFAADPPADPPTTPAEPSIEGTWNVTGRACTSNAQLKDNIKIGTDTLSMTNNADMSFEYKTNIAGCETVMKGTYVKDGMKVDYSATSSQGCKDTAPVPMNETHSMFIAHLSDTEAVTVATGDMAEMSCPAGDALVVNWAKDGATPTPPTP